jgi:tetratricopeptide (TPR) repeat protein
MQGPTAHLVRTILTIVMAVIVGGGFIYMTVRKSPEPGRVIVKWAFTIPLLLLLIFWAAPTVGQGGYGGAFMGIPLTAALSLGIGLIWRHNLAMLVASPIASLYDGGNTPPDPHPTYSLAQARQKQGLHQDAADEVMRQLAQFPTDVEGHLLLAEIQAVGLRDMPAAEATIMKLFEHPNHAPKNLVFALYSLADWHLTVKQDRHSARLALNEIIKRFPDTEYAIGAAQRIAHLGDPNAPLDPNHGRKFVVTEVPRNLGVLKDYRAPTPQEATPMQRATEYVRHLEQHPMDTEAREALARLYAEEMGRLDLAASELNQMIEYPNQPLRQVVRWLNLLADLQIHSACAYETVRATLQRIVDLDPHVASADVARRRLDLLKLELKGNEVRAGVKMGAYEQNIGLNRAREKGPQ